MRSAFASLGVAGAALVMVLSASCRKEEAKLSPPPPSTREEIPALANLAKPEGVPARGSKDGSLPTGNWIAFVREKGERRDTFLVRPTGKDLRPLPLPAGATGAFPSMSLPDGSGLVGVAVQDLDDYHSEQVVLWRLHPEISVVKLGPSSGRSRNPVVSPDGARVAFESGAESFSDLRVVGIDGKDLRRLTDNAEGNFEPAWSPDGKALVFTSSRDGDPEIYRVSADGTGQERLTAFHLEDGQPRWAPVGERIAFLSNREGSDALYLMKPDGTGQRRVLPALAKADAFTEPSERDAAWSPDGRKLALVRPGPGGKAAIHLVDVESGKAHALTDGSARDDQPAFSPDGRFIAFVSDRTGTAQIWVMRADGSGQSRVTVSDASDWRPVWVPSAIVRAQ